MVAKRGSCRFLIFVLPVFAFLAVVPGVMGNTSLVSGRPLEMKAGWPVNVWGNYPDPSSNIFPVPNFAPIGTLNTIPPCYQGQAGVAECDQQVLEAINCIDPLTPAGS